MAAAVMGSSGEPIAVILLNGHGINYPVTSYIYIQPLVLLSVFVREAFLDSELQSLYRLAQKN